MKRIALVFLLSILLPAALLAVLALRSLRDQELVVDSQRTRLHQSTCDALAGRIDLFLNDLRAFHAQLVDELVAEEGDGIPERFDAALRARWSQAAAAAVVQDGRTILSPRPEPGSRAAAFLDDHADFLTNRRVVEIYQAPSLLGVQVEPDRTAPERLETRPDRSSLAAREAEAPQKWKVGVSERRGASPSFAPPPAPAPAAASAPLAMAESDAGMPAASTRFRNVMPAQQRAAAEEGRVDGPTLSDSVPPNLSTLVPAAASNYEVTAEGNEGAVSRLLDGELHILLWKRHPADPRLTFWTELDLDAVRADLAGIFEPPQEAAASREASFALLDSGGGLVAQTLAGFAADWSAPFVASEIGPLLPRWEVAAYLTDPASLNAAARNVRITLWVAILALFGAVAAGSALVLRSVGDEMRLAARKTDFVGNVSHELKTPLTSIRMFSELLGGAERPDPEKTRHYAEVISRESARLARLIDRLLDFSKLDRGEMRLERTPIDLSSLVEETGGGIREPFEAAGMAVELELPGDGGPTVLGDRDALAQVVLNLLGNALKYAAGGRSVRVAVEGGPKCAVLSVADHGPGVPRAHRRRIFERFYRVDESISSGIDGSGIGLALCRQIAERHGGAIRHEPRKGGGSVFILELPLAP